MIQDLPYGGFKFLSKKEVSNFNLDSIPENSPTGYILEVDLGYCKEPHDSHNYYPLYPEKIEVGYDMLSEYLKDIPDSYAIKVGGVKKLIPNLGDKITYVVHYKNLQCYLSLGIKLVKIHRILKFKQSNWLKSYTAKKRQESLHEFSKGLYKLLNKCIYGKSIENIRKRINVKLSSDKKVYQKIVNKPSFVSQKIFDKNFVAIHCSKKVLTLNKSIYVGFCILELSKLKLCYFHYNYVSKTFNNVKLLFTDTDSLSYEIKNGKVYDQCFKDKYLFDFSGYPKNSVYYDDSNKKVLSKMKDELNGNKIDEFAGLKSKIYSLISSDGKEINKTKVVNLNLRHKEYVDLLFNKKVVRHKMKRMQSKLH